MISGPFDPTWIARAARNLGFNQDDFERGYRLARLLREIGEHPWLQVHAGLPRLSVDLDLNYIGAVGPEEMKAEKPTLMKQVGSLVRAFGYEPRDERHAYAGVEVGRAGTEYRSAETPTTASPVAPGVGGSTERTGRVTEQTAKRELRGEEAKEEEKAERESE